MSRFLLASNRPQGLIKTEETKTEEELQEDEGVESGMGGFSTTTTKTSDEEEEMGRRSNKLDKSTISEKQVLNYINYT